MNTPAFRTLSVSPRPSSPIELSASTPPERQPVASIREELRRAVKELSERGLMFACKWAAELLVACKKQELNQRGTHLTNNTAKHTVAADGFAVPFARPRSRSESQVSSSRMSVSSSTAASASRDTTPTQSGNSSFSGTTEAVEDEVLLAKSFFDLREYRRAANLLESLCRPGVEGESDLQSLSHHAFFLRNYAMYLAGEKRKEEEQLELSDPLKRHQVSNRHLTQLHRTLQQRHDHSNLDGFGLYLLGVVLQQMGQNEQARAALVQSVSDYPCNWSAWKLLAELSMDKDVVANLSLTQHWMREFFKVDVCLELYQRESDQLLTILDNLAEQFPDSTYLISCYALAHYYRREFDDAQAVFEELKEVDPYRLDDMDTYSNVLYVKEDSGDLADLAHDAVLLDKYRPQTCCIVGNYYSLKGQHERAVVYFKRALRLNTKYLAAWTLMGHEYVEMHNQPAAIESYRRAVDINPRDYRAWYGLGQTYEILSMHSYALYYFRRAALLRPYDARMWCAMAASYQALGRTDEAVQCYLRAENNGDREGLAVVALARLYTKIGEMEKAAHCYRQLVASHDAEHQEQQQQQRPTSQLANDSAADEVLRREEGGEELSDSVVDALLFLARHYLHTRPEEARRCCLRVLDVGGAVREQARVLLLELQESANMRDQSFAQSQSQSQSQSHFNAFAPHSHSQSHSHSLSQSHVGHSAFTPTVGRRLLRLQPQAMPMSPAATPIPISDSPSITMDMDDSFAFHAHAPHHHHQAHDESIDIDTDDSDH